MSPDISAYSSVMEEIKRRTTVITALRNEKANVVYKATQIESMVLQVRMITELIALATLAANKGLFEETKKKFDKHWHPDKIIKDIIKLNSNFYPVPIKENISKQAGVATELVALKKGFLTQEGLVAIHGRCGDLLHAKNPYGKGVDYSLYEKMVPQWMDQIKTLLNCHKIQLLDDSVFYLVHMQQSPDNKVHVIPFEKVVSNK